MKELRYRTISYFLIVCSLLAVISGCKSLPGVLGTGNISNDETISTSIKDVGINVSFLDDFNPRAFTPLRILPRTKNGGFILRPGVFEFNAQSYCLHAGKYGPTKGDGYLSAPLKGARAKVIQNILRKSVAYPTIPQPDIQLLIWGILANTKITDMSRSVQIAAARLLTPKELLEINGGVLGLIPDAVKEKAIASLPPEVQEAFKLESQLREMLTKANASYEEIERLAVKLGAAPKGEGSRDIPGGRWNFHSDGYFIRYFPSGYSNTKIQIFVPEQITVTRDSFGRIKSIDNGRGDRIQTTYADDLGAIPIASGAAKGFAFQSIVFTARGKNGSEKYEIKNTGWMLAESSEAKATGVLSARFKDVNDRWQINRQLHAQIENILNYQSTAKNPKLPMLVDLANYEMAVRKAVADAQEKNPWVSDQPQLIKKAWSYEFSKAAGGSGGGNSANPPAQSIYVNTNEVNTAGGDPSPSSGLEFDPSDNAAMPGNTASQRLAQSGRSSDPDKPPKKCNPAESGSDCPDSTYCSQDVDGKSWICCPSMTFPCNGVCVPESIENRDACYKKCDEGLSKCGATCKDLSSDPGNCGQCGKQCQGIMVCVNGACTCPEGSSDCGGTCRDLEVDPRNCGSCGNVCSGGNICVNGECQCPSGKEKCAGDCVDVASDPLHCGGCGVKCGDGQACCNGFCADLLKDPLNCGVCGTSCGNGACCGGICKNILADQLNCGQCGIQCLENKTCENGKCVCGQKECDAGKGKVVDPNTCECVCPQDKPDECGGYCTNLKTSQYDCGQCNRWCGGAMDTHTDGKLTTRWYLQCVEGRCKAVKKCSLNNLNDCQNVDIDLGDGPPSSDKLFPRD
jgi:hypothetical protein